MRSALVNIASGLVENMIVADPSVDKTPDGYLMISNLPTFVEIGTVWDGTKFIDPHPALRPTVITGLKTL